jgi:monofunctional biosynthetic peptidoglycan transglycosylase
LTGPGRLATLAKRTSAIGLAAAAGLFATAAYVWFLTPDVRPLRRENPKTTAFMAMRLDEARANRGPLRARQQWVSLDRISPHLRQAVLIGEDAAFYQHAGVDWDELHDAILDTVERGEPLRGASTITQQLAKNLYLSPARNPYRKLEELFITRRLEAVLSKRRILELYLNVVEWGDGIWGAEAAAQTYFNEPAADLSVEEGALLAASLMNPRRYNPAHPNATLLGRQTFLLKRIAAVEVWPH